MTAQSPEFNQFRCRSRLQALRRRSQSAANVDSDRHQHAAVTLDPTAVDEDLVWEQRQRRRRESASNGLSAWLQRRLMTFGRAAPIVDGRRPRVPADAPPRRNGANVVAAGGGGHRRPHTAHGSSPAAASAGDALSPTPCYDCKCVSCPELADTPSVVGSNGAPAEEQRPRCDADDKQPRHEAVRKSCSDVGFGPLAAETSSASDNSRRSRLSVPAVFVTSYTRSVESWSQSDQHSRHHHDHHQQQRQQQQQQQRRRQRLMSMSDSLLGNGDHFTASPPPAPHAAARIWKLTEFLCKLRYLAAIVQRCINY